MGCKKKAWKAKVWEVLHSRFMAGQLLTFTYSVAASAAPEPEQAAETFTPQAASSSGFQETLNEPVPEQDIGCVNFPKSNPVEEDPVSCGAPDDDSAQGSDEKSKEDIEAAMCRWVEMVECVCMLESITWLGQVADTPENAAALTIIFKHGMKYCTTFLDSCLQPWNLSDWPLNPRVWLAELERVLKTMVKKGWCPYWLRFPHERNIRDDASASADGSTDPGNYVLDVVVHALRLWQYSESSRIPRVMKQSIVEYGERANKSSHGPVNLRGNIVEAMQRDLQKAGSKKGRHEEEYDAVKYWWEWEAETASKWQASQEGRTQQEGASGSSSGHYWRPRSRG